MNGVKKRKLLLMLSLIIWIILLALSITAIVIENKVLLWTITGINIAWCIFILIDVLLAKRKFEKFLLKQQKEILEQAEKDLSNVDENANK